MSIPVPPASKLEIERQRYKALLMNTSKGTNSSLFDKDPEKEYDLRYYPSTTSSGTFSPQDSPSKKLLLQSLNISNDPIDSLLNSPTPRTPLLSKEFIHNPSSPNSNLIPSSSSSITTSKYPLQFSNDDKDNVIILLQEENQELKHKLNSCIDSAETHFRELEENILTMQTEYELKINELETKLKQYEQENNELKLSLELKQSMLDVESDELRKALLIIQRLGYNQSSYLKSQSEFHKLLKLSSSSLIQQYNTKK